MGVCSLRLFMSGFILIGRCPCWSVCNQCPSLGGSQTTRRHRPPTPDSHTRCMCSRQCVRTVGTHWQGCHFSCYFFRISGFSIAPVGK